MREILSGVGEMQLCTFQAGIISYLILPVHHGWLTNGELTILTVC